MTFCPCTQPCQNRIVPDLPLDAYARYANDSLVLATIGRALRRLTDGSSLIPTALAEHVRVAWERIEEDEAPSRETDWQQMLRDDAATLALIGLAVERAGDPFSGDTVRVELDQEILSSAAAAAARNDQ